MKRTLQAALAAMALVAAGHAAAQITLYEGEGFRGRAITTNDRLWNLERSGLNDRVSSIVVERGRWEVCEDARFEGRCAILRRGSYPTLRDLGLNNRISSVRPFEGRGHARMVEPVPVPLPPPAPQAAYQWRPQVGEQTYEVPVHGVRAIAGPPSQRCWVERQQVAQPAPGGEANIGGALIGGIVGGVLGHQVGGGTGKDLATAGGAIAGAVVGSNVANGNNGGARVASRDVQRCENVANVQPEYYDVVYFHEGVEHHVQMKQPPGPTIRINARGEPRM